MAETRDLAGAPVFKPMRKHTTILGLTGRGWLQVAIVTVAGLALTFALGGVTEVREVPIDATTRLSYSESLNDMRSAVEKRDRLSDAMGTTDMSMLDLTDAERTMVAKATAMGITSATTDAQLDALVPSTVEKEVEVFDFIPRLAVLFVIPVASTLMWNMDMKGYSLKSETKRVLAFARRQRVYVPAPRRDREER